MLLRLGRHAIPTRDLPNLDAVIGRAIFANQFFQRGSHPRLDFGLVRRAFGNHRLFDEMHYLLQRDRRLRRVDNRFELSF